ncbi:MAG: protein kinase [Chloroflexota bacterium]|nr:protein kinase [Chloroflexota bacterium]
MIHSEIILEKYRIKEELCKRQDGVVYQGVDTKINQAVLLTILDAELISPQQFLASFELIAETLKGLDSPYGTTLLDYGEHDGQAVVVQEFIVGQSLMDMLVDSDGLPVNLVLDIAQQIGEYLHDLHQAGLVHGGLSTDSIFLSSQGIVRIQNAGQAQGIDLAGLLNSGKVESRPYHAPELRSGSELTPQADFYALGATLSETLTGEAPELDSPDPHPGRVKAGLPPELDELVAKCLQPDLTIRIRNALELLRELEGVHRGMRDGAESTILGMEDALIGHTLGAYQLVDRLGQGGMATVYKAYEPALDRYVAVKVLPQFFARDPNFMQRFRREARAIAQLNHPNIVPIHNYGEEGDITYLVMRYVEGGTLQQGRGSVYDPERAVRLIIPVASALAYAHKQGIIHRDIKPGNVLLSGDDWPLLTDFGLAKMMEDATRLTKTGVGVGTPVYMSPEQGHGAEVDHRTDIYSLGIMLYEMLTGEVPFRAATPMAIIIKHINAPMPMPRKVNPNISETLEGIILKATAKSPDNRFQTADEMIAALEQVISISTEHPKIEAGFTAEMGKSEYLERERRARESGENEPKARMDGQPSVGAAIPASSSAESPAHSAGQDVRGGIQSTPPSQTLMEYVREHWRLLALIFVPILLLIIVGSFLVIQQATQNQQVPIEAVVASTATVTLLPVVDAVDLTQTATLPFPSDTPVSTATIVLTATIVPTDTPRPQGLGGGTGQIAFVSDRGGDMQIYLLTIDSGIEPQLLAEIPGGACQPAWSPDGAQLVFVSPCESQKEMYPDSSLHLINADGSGWTPLPVGAVGNYDPTWSPDGTHIAFTSLREGLPQIYTFSLDDNSVVSLSSGHSHDLQPAWSPDGNKLVFVSTRIGNYLLFTMSDQGKSVVQFTRDTDSNNTHPHWSPDGGTILNMQLNNIGIPVLVDALYEKQGFGEQVVIPKFTAPMRDPAYSPDGFWVAFSSNRDGHNHNIWIITASGVEPRELTSDPAYDFDPAWRP